MKIFVTGATGVIGRRLLPLLIAAGHQVTGMVRSAPKRALVERLGASAAEVDLFDSPAVKTAVAGHDAVINLATHIPSSSVKMLMPGAWRENDRIRHDGSRILVDAAIAGGAERFIQESFAPIYADGGDGWIDEHAPVAPSAYNQSVVDAEQSVERFTAAGCRGTVLRFALFYGPDSPSARDLIASVKKGWAPLPGRRDGYVSSISHDDAATAVAAALDAPPGIYNATDDEPVRRSEFVAALAQMLGVAEPKWTPAWIWRLAGSVVEPLSRSLRISNRKLWSTTGWAPRYPSVREGWRAVVESF